MIEANPADSLILNVDDYLPGRYARTRLLQGAGYQVIEAGTGKETLQILAEKKPSLILLDVNLPDASGFDVCKKIRSDPQGDTITILHISASSVLTQHQVSGLESGADGYLVEPVEPAVLLATVNAFLRARRAEDEMRRTNEELRWFAYRVAHDLSEPLRTMTSFSQLLRQRLGSDESPENLKLLDFISEGAIKVRQFIDSLLEYSRVTSSKTELRSINAGVLVKRVIGSLGKAIEESGAEITVDPLPDVQANDQLEYVFQNLLSNSIKYRRPAEPLKVHIGVRSEGSNWVFSIRDNGIGVEPEFREKIFEVFRRLHGSDIPGNGIGLALARKVMDAHGGRIWVESESGAGSTFFVRLPKEPTQQAS
jgi:signal transduction histidine kinase